MRHLKNIFFLSFFLLSVAVHSNGQAFVNPTGTYLLKGDVKSNKIVGHYGELRVRLLDTSTIAMCFYMNAGYPNYEYGAMVDTLRYADNAVIYKPEKDSSCSIFFVFDLRSVSIFDMVTDPQSECGFRPGVIVPAVFAKRSSDAPVIQDLSVHGSF